MSNDLSIKNWNIDDQPREKLRDKGKTTLSNAELIAILIGSGNRDESAVQLAKRILASVENNLNKLAACSILELCKFKGIGEAKAISIIAAITLGTRMQAQDILKKPKISSSHDAYRIIKPYLTSLSHEEFWVIYLNNSNAVLAINQLSKGGITSTIIDIRMLFKKGLELLAISIIVAHNHPSEQLKPSDADKKITQKIKEGGCTLDIKLLDHLIVTSKDYYSFADEGII